MKAMIFAAGYGKRLRPYTFLHPKPLMPIGNTTLIERLLQQSVEAGIHEWVINVGYMGSVLQDRLGDGTRYGGKIDYLEEPHNSLLNTGSSVVAALPLLRSDPFAVISGDLYTEMNFFEHARRCSAPHLWLTAQHSAQDFSIDSDGKVNDHAALAYANMGVFTADFFHGFDRNEKVGLGTIIRKRLQEKTCIYGSLVNNEWRNISTPQDYRRLINHYAKQPA